MTQLNKAKKKIEQKAWDEGYKKGKKDYQIWHYCYICGKEIYVKPNDISHKNVIKYMSEHKWRHGDCHKKEKAK